MSQSHEVLGNVASNERREAMQKDEAKLAELLYVVEESPEHAGYGLSRNDQNRNGT